MTPSGHLPAVSIARAQGTVVLTIEGPVDPSGAERLEHLLGDLIEGQGNQSIALDLRAAGQVDPSVLAMLAAVSDRVLRGGGLFVLRDPSAAVADGLDRAGLCDLVEVRVTRRP